MMQLLRVFSLALLALGLLNCSGNKYKGKIIAVKMDSVETLEGAQLVLVDPHNPQQEPEELFSSFHSAASPSLSHDACHLYFQAKENADDPWQIWVADLKKNQVSKVTSFTENCTGPAALPDSKVVFSREGEILGIPTTDLWKCGMDGCCLMQLSHDPYIYTHSSVLWEGRILYLSTQQYPDASSSQLMVMKPDGAKAELYSKGKDELYPSGKGVEGPDGCIYFISTGGKLSRVMHTRPLHTFELISGDLKGSFSGVHPCADSTLLVSYRPTGESTYSIYSIDPENPKEPTLLFSCNKNLVDPLPVRIKDPRPRILPSALNPEYSTALLLCQNINHSMLPIHDGIKGDSLACRIRISTLDGEHAVVEAKDDGSVYIKLDADTPFRIETLNGQGEVLRGPSDWIYMRPAERRACTGCHVNPELAPRNYQPHAIKEDPVILVMHVVETSH